MSSVLCMMQQPAGQHSLGGLQPGGAASTCCPSSSLLFSLEVEEEHSAVDRQQTAKSTQTARIQYLCQPDMGCCQLVLDVRRMMRVMQEEAAAAAADSSIDVVDMASRLSAMGYRVTVRTALGGGPACFRNLRHEFLTVLGEGDYKDVPYIVDPAFKEQFRIPSPTSGYSAVLDLLPSEFVGTSSRLVPLVQSLCAEMVASFEANGLTLPPWRRSQSMLTKWLPSRSRDVNVSAVTVTADGSSSSAGAYSSTSPSGSPTGAEAAGGHSPFSRIDDHNLLCRQGSGRSLLSGKLGGSAGCRSLDRTASSSSTTSSSTISSGSRSAGASQASSSASMQHAQQLLRLHQQARQLSQQLGSGAISRQPSLYQGQPPTYTVRMGALAGMPQQQQRQ